MLPYLIAGAIGFAVAKLFEEDETPKYDEGGLVGNIFTQIIYYALLNTETYTEVYAEGNDLEEIQKQYNSIISSDFNNPNSNYNSKLLESRINQYEFIGGDDLNAEDYIDDLENTDYWNLTDENYNVIETDSVFAINNSTDEMIDEIREFIKQEYNIGGRYAEKYMRINIYDENEDYINDLQIRIADHSQNPKNNRNDYTLSFVIANNNPTENKFYPFGEEYYYDDNSDIEDIKEQIRGIIDDKIENIKEKNYADGGSVLLAPNGKPSNLTPEQYKLVRTPEFKAWFGDWENDPANASKVVDYNGEPLPVYHGSKVGNIEIFNTKVGTKTKSKMQLLFGTHFAQSIVDAEIYAKEKGKIYETFLSIKNPIDLSVGYVNRDDKNFQNYYSLVNDLKLAKNNKNVFDYDLFTDSGNYGGKSKHIQRIFITQNKLDQLSPKNVRDYLIKNNFDGVIYTPYQPVGLNQISNFSKSFIALQPEQIKLADGTNTTFDANNPDIRFDGGGNVEKKKKITLVLDALTDSTYFGSSYNTFRYGYKDVDIVVNMVNKEYGYAKMKGKYAVINVESD
jgi:hypothetical protein